MDDWLMQKKMQEAKKIAQLRELEEKEEIQKQMREEINYKNYREWLKKQMLREKQDRYNNLVRKQELANREKEEYVKMRTDAMMEQQQWELDQKRRREEEEEPVLHSHYSPLRQKRK